MMQQKHIVAAAVAVGLAAVAVFAFTACGTSEAARRTVEVLDELLKSRVLTQAQYDVLRAGFEESDASKWFDGFTVRLFEYAGLFLGFRAWRGPSATAAERVARTQARRR